MVDKQRHINEAHQRFQRLMRWEIIPLIGLSFAVIVYFNFQTQILNLLMPHKLFKLQVFTDKEERFVARKISGLMSMQI